MAKSLSTAIPSRPRSFEKLAALFTWAVMSSNWWFVPALSPGLWTITIPWRSAMNMWPSGAQATFTGVLSPLARSVSVKPLGTYEVALALAGAATKALAASATARSVREGTERTQRH